MERQDVRIESVGKQGGRIVILGAGPAGLGAAWRLRELGHADWELFEKEPRVGGLASSHVDDCGFTWDLGGHVVFSHYPYFDRALDSVLENQWIEHVREAWIWMRGRFIPYPLQNNIRHLPTQELLECLEGLLDARDRAASTPATFADWIEHSFGPGLARVFMTPYNRKVWAAEPAELGTQWVGDRVATVDFKRVLGNVIEGRDDLGWGPNATFRFPLHGGTGRIWQAVAERLPSERLHLGAEAVEIDAAAKTVRLSDGRTVEYDWLITTMPLDLLLRRISDLRFEISDLKFPLSALRSQISDLKSQISEAAVRGGLRHSSVHVVGVGLDGPIPDSLAGKCWMYFPEPELPFYRVTVFSNYSPNNVPKPGRQWSLMAEVSEAGSSCEDSPASTHDASRTTHNEIVRRTLDGLKAARLVPPDATVASLWHKRIERGYPTPVLSRDAVLEKIEPALIERGILSRGRFGAWKYEVGNMDHSFMQGVEAVDRVLLGRPETTVRFPAEVNRQPASRQ
ncbi:MAG: FAD-dependent oxidoreductase [Phycisphaerales bacterium]